MKVQQADPWQAWIAYLGTLDWAAGDTKHSQSYTAFIRAGSLGIDPAAARREVEARIRSSGGKVVPRDMERQIERGYAYARKDATEGVAPVATSVTRSYYSAADLVTRADRQREFTWEDLSRRSPVDPSGLTSAQYLDAVFRPGESVVIVKHREDPGRVYVAGSGESWVNGMREEEGVLYLSNPTNGARKLNDAGNMSLRSEGNVTAYRHLVVESDRTIPILWIRAMVQIPLPIVAIYTSGGKSVHFLVRVDAADKVEWQDALDRLRPGLVRLGADPAAMSGVRLTRLPGAMRGERRQLLLFLDPAASSTPIAERPERPAADPVGEARQMFNTREIASYTADEWAAEVERRKQDKMKWGQQYE